MHCIVPRRILMRYLYLKYLENEQNCRGENRMRVLLKMGVELLEIIKENRVQTTYLF